MKNSFPLDNIDVLNNRILSLKFLSSLIKSLGNHIKKRRLDLKILQKEAAKKIGVDKTTIWLWENNRVEPSISFIPKIIEFLGYIPFDTEYISLGEKIITFRRIHGLSCPFGKHA